MSWQIGTVVTDTHGPMHSGSGDQYNNLITPEALAHLRGVKGDPSKVGQGHLERLYRTFVRPDNYQQAADKLKEAGAVLLAGAAGSGRRTTALMLLGHHGHVHETGAEELGDSRLPRQGERHLIDFSGTDRAAFDAGGYGLASFYSAAQEAGAELAVVLPGRHHGLRDDLEALVVEIGRPEAKEVLLSCLIREQIIPADPELDDARLTEYLATAPMRDVARLARLIAHARDSGRASGGFAGWLRHALLGQTGHRPEVAAKVRALEFVEQRALLLSAAMLSGGRAESVHRASGVLLRTLEQPEDETPLLQREGLIGSLAEVGAEVDLDGRVGMGAFGDGRDVRAHFWTNYPDLRSKFGAWTDRLLDRSDLGAGERAELVGRFTEQCLRTGAPGELADRIERWAGEGKVFQEAAALALARGLADEDKGWFFRSQMYHWAARAEVSGQLTTVLIDVCSTVLAASHPEQAIVRLHHIVRRAGESESLKARTALRQVVGGDDRLYRFLLERVGIGMEQQLRSARELLLFLELVSPDFLLHGESGSERDSGPVRALLMLGWRAALRKQGSRDLWEPSLRDWLTAVVAERSREWMADVLIGAVMDTAPLMNQLYAIALRWASGEQERAAFFVRLRQKIDNLQGIEGLGHGLVRETGSHTS